MYCFTCITSLLHRMNCILSFYNYCQTCFDFRPFGYSTPLWSEEYTYSNQVWLQPLNCSDVDSSLFSCINRLSHSITGPTNTSVVPRINCFGKYRVNNVSHICRATIACSM